MITALDSCIAIDLLVDDPIYGDRSANALRQARRDGSLIICAEVAAEIMPVINPAQGTLRDFMHDLEIEFLPSNLAVAEAAGRSFTNYLARGGKRGRVVADFIIGHHSLQFSDRLLTRDEGFQRDYFPDLKIWYP